MVIDGLILWGALVIGFVVGAWYRSRLPPPVTPGTDVALATTRLTAAINSLRAELREMEESRDEWRHACRHERGDV